MWNIDIHFFFLFTCLRQNLELLNQSLQHPDLQMKKSTIILSWTFKATNLIVTNTRWDSLNSHVQKKKTKKKTEYQTNSISYHIPSCCIYSSYGVKSITRKISRCIKRGLYATHEMACHMKGVIIEYEKIVDCRQLTISAILNNLNGFICLSFCLLAPCN